MSSVRTIQAHEETWWMNGFFEEGEPCEFPFPFVLRQNPGRWLYIVYQGLVVGRCRILRIEPRNVPVEVGSDEHLIEARCAVIVERPGERTPVGRVIPVRGFMGIRYVQGGGDWDDVERWANLRP